MESKINTEIIKTQDNVFQMLDELIEKRDQEWWNIFYTDRNKPIPFFKNAPDENLVSYLNKGIFKKGRVLDIGCGNGRNSLYLAKQGYQVDGIDFSQTSIEWAIQRVREELVNVNFYCESVFEFNFQPSSYDYIYDSGCLHHIKPHRRYQYLEIVRNSLKCGGYFGLVCFNLKGGANISDFDVYRNYSMKGGLAFTEDKLREVLGPYFEIVELRGMKEVVDDSLF